MSRPISLPLHAHPLVRGLVREANDQRASFDDIASRTNIGRDTLRFWRWRHMPRVDLLDAALNALDLELAIVPKGTRDADGFARRRIRQ